MTPLELRRAVYGLLFIVTIGWTAGRIFNIERVYEPSLHRAESEESYRPRHAHEPPRSWPKARPEPTPMFSSNDRSRWATIRALVDEGTFAIGERIIEQNTPKGYYDEGIIFESDYASVDKILNPETNKFYSSKPPLLPLMIAAEYALLQSWFGWTLVNDPWPVVIVVLLTVNLLPFAIYLLLLMRLVEQLGTTDWGKLFVFTAACFGTFLTMTAVALNNHLPATCCVLYAVYPYLRGQLCWATVMRSGLFAGLAMAMELPAAVFLVGLGLLWLLRSPRLAFLVYAPMALVPLLALGYTNYLAIGEWQPAYAKFGSVWYEYPGSHWYQPPDQPSKAGIDFADESKPVYAFHNTFGHHGIFSLTPIWLFAFVGMIGLSWQCRQNRTNLTLTGLMSFVASLIVIAFYVWKTNNYGGWTAGPRWFYWLTPLWLIAMLPMMDRLALTRWGRGLAMVALLVSVFSAGYPSGNPNRHPWLYQMTEYYGWMSYERR